jgi:CheY-like chemotaxis protein
VRPAGTTGAVQVEAPLVLLVDDFDDNREMYAQYLQYLGFRTAEARDGVEALAQARQLVPDAIVMDLGLPRLDGWSTTQALKGDPALRHIPVLALTGHALAGESEHARAAGCDGFVTKPCLPDQLATELRRLLSPRGSPRNHARKRNP